MAKLQTTKEVQMNNLAHSNFIDKVMMGVAAFVLVGLSYDRVLTYVRATEPVNYMLAGGFVAFLLYVVLSPLYRK